MAWKDGIINFFFHLANFTGKEEHESLAVDLLNSVIDNLNLRMQASFGSGLAGIGTGIEYLIQEKFISGDGNEILKDIDNLIFQKIINSENYDCGLKNGICGIGKYFLYRIKNRMEKEDLVTLKNKQNIIYLLDLLDCHKQLLSDYKDEILSFLLPIWKINIYNFKVEKLIRYYAQQEIFDADSLSKALITRCQKRQENILKSLQCKKIQIVKFSNIGLKNGYAGIGLAILTTLNSSKSWIDLIN